MIRGSIDDGDFTAFYVDDGRVTAALTVGRSDDLEHARRFIRDNATPDTAGPPTPTRTSARSKRNGPLRDR